MKRPWKKLILILVLALIFGLAGNPSKAQESNIPFIGPVWNWFANQTVHLGLDLQGGTQLDYEIDLSEAKQRNNNDNPEDDVDVTELVQGVKEVIEQRVNALGVSEPNIYLSEVGTEQHIVVELAGVSNIDEAKEKVGKVVLLEFKEQKTELEANEEAAIRSAAQGLLSGAHQSAELESLVGDLPENIDAKYVDEGWSYIDEINEAFQDKLLASRDGQLVRELIESNEGYTLGANNSLEADKGFNIIRLLDRRTSLRRAPKNGEDFLEVGKEVSADSTSFSYIRESDVPKEIRKEVSALGVNDVSDVLEASSGYYIYTVDEVLEKNAEENYIRASHILLNTEENKTIQAEKPLVEIPADADAATKARIESQNRDIERENAGIQRENEVVAAENVAIDERNELVRVRAQEVLDRVNAGEDFAALATELSQDTGTKPLGGDLGFFKEGDMVAPFERAAYELKVGETSDLVKSSFGYHIILKTDEKQKREAIYRSAHIRVCYEGAEGCESTVAQDEAKKVTEGAMTRIREEQQLKWERILFSTLPDPWKETGLDGRFFKRADVAYDQTTFRPFVSISFDDEGAKLFEELTEKNIGKPIAIFVGGEFISAPRVNDKISGGQAQITLGITNVQEALEAASSLARNLNAGAIPAPLKKPNELNVSSSLGQDALSKSLQAGAIGLALLVVYMIIMYRLPGLLAAAALVVYALFLMFVVQSTVPDWFANLLTGGLWLYFVLKVFSSRMDAWSKTIFVILSVFGIFFVSSVLANPVVLTLAGIAGVVLSIGMAVDANILIFERIKEEFRGGRDFVSAVEVGFERAWSSILDSNVSSLITCGILFFFGTSIIRGFAVNLALGILISMFSAIVVTRTFLLLFGGTKTSKVKSLWVGK